MNKILIGSLVISSLFSANITKEFSGNITSFHKAGSHYFLEAGNKKESIIMKISDNDAEDYEYEIKNKYRISATCLKHKSYKVSLSAKYYAYGMCDINFEY